jgi:hypothetical protein
MFAIALALLKLTFRDVVTDIPHDTPALVVYLLLGLFIAGIWYGSRTRSAREGAGSHGMRDHA